MRAQPSLNPFLPVIERKDGRGQIVLICEHASNMVPAAWGTLGLSQVQLSSHIAFDLGALGLARGLSRRLDATLIHVPVSRLVYDCNRAPDMHGAVPVRSEIHDIPGNVAISPEERLARTQTVYLPFQNCLHNLLAERIALGRRPVVVTIHSFTPVYFGKKRAVEFGVIHDDNPAYAFALVRAARQTTQLVTELNAPYSAADDVTHTLRVAATPYGLQNAMLEIRNDLIASAAAQDAMAEVLAPVLNMGLVEIQRQAKAG